MRTADRQISSYKIETQFCKLRIDPRCGQKIEPGISSNFVSIRRSHLNISNWRTGNEGSRLCKASIFFVFSTLTKPRYRTQCCVQNDTFWGRFCQISGAFFLVFLTWFYWMKKQNKMRYLCDSFGPGDHGWGRFFFRFVVFQTLSTENNKDIALHELYDICVH